MQFVKHLFINLVKDRNFTSDNCIILLSMVIINKCNVVFVNYIMTGRITSGTLRLACGSGGGL